MSFGESMFSAGFIQKTIKGGLFVKGNYGIPPRKQRGKPLKDSRRLSTEADPEGLPCGVGRLTPHACWPAYGSHQSAFASKVSFPPPLRFNLRRLFKLV